MTIFMFVVGFMANSAPPAQTYNLIALTIMSFSMSYLYPQFKQNDERMKLIRYKGLTYSFFALVVYYIVLSGIIQFNIVSLSAMEVLNILAALMISTVFISMVILAKRN
ncbi:permease [Lentibacillus sp. Marseille-P4043]|uniref:permease n=1 Tax=Lentibacillus sp. Marseille-P4043 TaxID=2040293 RepID=UPI000D0B9F2E|nr:permease [Lentibacillus sp. Marseille-P4043]